MNSMVLPEVDVIIDDDRWREALPSVEKDVTRVVHAVWSAGADVPGMASEIALVLTGDEAVQQLNKKYRGKDKPTNVLSFPAWDGEVLPLVSLGDVVIAYDTVQRETEEQGKPFWHHVAHMVAHGTLHLLGYDHEADAEAEEMESLEIKVLEIFTIDNPYENDDL